MSTNDQLKAMLQDLINDRPEQAEVAIHDYIVAKTQSIANTKPVDTDVDSDEGTSE